MCIRDSRISAPGSAFGGDVLAQLVAKARPLVMGVLNVTPDSFSDGGRFFDPQAAIAQARRLAQEGADILDVGAESTRPYGGAARVPLEEERARLAPVLSEVIGLGVPVSIDTLKAVSYTHLDVYKRQDHGDAALGNDAGHVGVALQAPYVVDDCRALINRPGRYRCFQGVDRDRDAKPDAVSYTHLDVYKRQPAALKAASCSPGRPTR